MGSRSSGFKNTSLYAFRSTGYRSAEHGILLHDIHFIHLFSSPYARNTIKPGNHSAYCKQEIIAPTFGRLMTRCVSTTPPHQIPIPIPVKHGKTSSFEQVMPYPWPDESPVAPSEKFGCIRSWYSVAPYNILSILFHSSQENNKTIVICISVGFRHTKSRVCLKCQIVSGKRVYAPNCGSFEVL